MDNTTHVGYNNLNRLEYSNRQGYSKFDLSVPKNYTFRFADITPISCFRSVLGDKFTTKISQQVMNYTTLNSPMLGTMRCHQDFFCVPRIAMMPHTYERLFVNPNKGDDVPDDAYPNFNLRGLVNTIFGPMYGRIKAHQSDQTHFSPTDFYALILAYHICGYGTLPDYFNDRSSAFVYPATSFVGENQSNLFAYTFGQVFDRIFGEVIKRKPLVTILDETGKSIAAYSLSSPENVRRLFFDLTHTTQEWYLSVPISADEGLLYSDFVPILDFVDNYLKFWSFGTDDVLPYVAYQMACAEYFTNDTVDSIFTSKLWLQNMESIANRLTPYVSYPQYFDWNDLPIQYDVFSNHMLTELASATNTLLQYDPDDTYAFNEKLFYIYSFWLNLFAIRPCLRYMDYFVGSRTRPLAVGDISAPVVDNQVSAIDTTKSISYQRFLNAVNRASQDISGYAKAIFGVEPTFDPCRVRAMASEFFPVKDQVNINTAEDQGTRKGNINCGVGSKFAFETQFKDEVYCIGVCYFDFILSYPYTTDRFNFHKDRFDDFQPMLQNIGDQPVYLSELRSCVPDQEQTENVFGYQIQDAEYKFVVPTSHGGCINQLPSWFFIDYDSLFKSNIDSDFIRLRPYMLDRYFSQISGMSPETYFHFISVVNVTQHALRKMEFKPGIL